MPLLVAALVIGGCGGRGDGDPSPGTTSAVEGSITVSAAASLRDAFTDIGVDFTSGNPGAEVTFNFDSSATLASQVLAGAPADVFAAADEESMARLADEGVISGVAQPFARNELVLVTKPGNPRGIRSLGGLATAGVISLCGVDVPCGRYAAEALDEAGVTVSESDVSRAQNARAALTAVSAGDAVAGIVYTTDARSAGDAVEVVPLPAAIDVTARYVAGVIDDTDHRGAAEAFLAHLLGPAGRRVLQEHGFLVPG